MKIVNDRKIKGLLEAVLRCKIALTEIMRQEFPEASKINVLFVITSDFIIRSPNKVVKDALGRIAECENVRQSLQMLLQVVQDFDLAFELRVEDGSNYPASRDECLNTRIAIVQRLDGMIGDSGAEWKGCKQWWQPEVRFERSLIQQFPIAEVTEVADQ
jgi:hypothetical protein